MEGQTIENPESQQRHQKREQDLRLHWSRDKRTKDAGGKHPEKISGRLRLVLDDVELHHAAGVLGRIPIEGEAAAEVRDAECKPQQSEREEGDALSHGGARHAMQTWRVSSAT